MKKEVNKIVKLFLLLIITTIFFNCENPVIEEDVDEEDEEIYDGGEEYEDGIADGGGGNTSLTYVWLYSEFVENENWRVDDHPRTIADVNGDSKGDIVAFGTNDIFVALSNGFSFTSQPIWMYGNYCYNQNYRTEYNPRVPADVNGDGKADIIAFGDNDVWVTKSNL